MTGVQDPETEGGQVQNPPEIKFYHEGEKIIVSPTNFNALFTDIKRFNNQFSMGSIMASFLLNRFENHGEEIRTDEETQKLTAGGISLIHSDVLDKTGLKVESVSGKTSRFYGPEGTTGSGELRVNVVDRGRFVNFLQAINPQITRESELGQNLQSLSNILAQQIFDHYDLKEPSDEALQLLGSLEAISREYKRLEIPGVDRLETYLAHSKKGDLREFLLVEQGGLLSEPGKNFGPADWQIDAGPDFLEERWNRALAVLQMARENPNARDLYNELYAHLSKCLDIAIENLENLKKPDGGGYPEEYTSRLRPVLQRVKQAFGL